MDNYEKDSIRISIVDTIIRHLSKERGISYFLLGFDFTKPIASQDLHNTTQSGCLRVADMLLSRSEFYTQHPRLAERLLALMSALCSDERVSIPVMTFLRQRDFFKTQLQRYANHREKDIDIQDLPYHLQQKSHVIKVRIYCVIRSKMMGDLHILDVVIRNPP